MMMSEQQPLNMLDADLRQHVEHRAVAQVDQEGGVAIAQDKHVASVGPEKNVRRDFAKARHAIESQVARNFSPTSPWFELITVD